MKRLTKVKVLLLRKTKLRMLPTERGACEGCGKPGHTRFFIAVKLDKICVICDDDYRQLRSRLEETLSDIIHEEFRGK